MNVKRMAIVGVIGTLAGVIIWLPILGGNGFDASAYFDLGTVIAIAFLLPFALAAIIFGYMATEKVQSNGD